MGSSSGNGECQYYDLHKFNPNVIEAKRTDPKQGPPSIILIGSKRTGKTYLIRDLMHYIRKIPTGIIITGSEGSSEVFSQFFPKSCIFNEVNKDMIMRFKKIVKTQRKLRKKGTTEDFSCFILFDDCGYDNKILKETIINGIFMNGRHWNILLIMAVQYCKSIPPAMRQNADYVFIMRQPSFIEREKIWKDFGGNIPDLKTFNDIMDHCTENYGCVLFDNTTHSNHLEKTVFWYRAKYPPYTNFRVGSEQLWEVHSKFYVSETESLSSQEDITRPRPRPKPNTTTTITRRGRGRGRGIRTTTRRKNTTTTTTTLSSNKSGIRLV